MMMGDHQYVDCRILLGMDTPPYQFHVTWRSTNMMTSFRNTAFEGLFCQKKNKNKV